jgi:hypothetical protein
LSCKPVSLNWFESRFISFQFRKSNKKTAAFFCQRFRHLHTGYRIGSQSFSFRVISTCVKLASPSCLQALIASLTDPAQSTHPPSQRQHLSRFFLWPLGAVSLFTPPKPTSSAGFHAFSTKRNFFAPSHPPPGTPPSEEASKYILRPIPAAANTSRPFRTDCLMPTRPQGIREPKSIVNPYHARRYTPIGKPLNHRDTEGTEKTYHPQINTDAPRLGQDSTAKDARSTEYNPLYILRLASISVNSVPLW